MTAPNIPVSNPHPDRLARFIERIAGTSSTGDAVRVIDVAKEYVMGKTTVKALNGVNLTVQRREYLSIMGPSGSGKTTLFNMMGGLDKPLLGQVFVDDVDIAELDPFELAWLRCRKIGYIFQSFNLVGAMSAIENVMLPMVFAGLTSEEALNRGVEILTRVGLGDRCLHKPAELSGGQQQRVAVARAFANEPAIILADEPTGNLDEETGVQVMDILLRLNKEHQTTFIMITHNPSLASKMQFQYRMENGQLHLIANK